MRICITKKLNNFFKPIIFSKKEVVLKIHDNVFLGLHYTIFCIRMSFRRIIALPGSVIPDREYKRIGERQDEDHQEKWSRRNI